MAHIKLLAAYLINKHQEITQSDFKSEIRLQKLMYFVQKESLKINGVPLFNSEMKGWVHGPVIPELRGYLRNNIIETYTEKDLMTLTEHEKSVIDSVIDQYSVFADWTLRDKTHEELAWRRSRAGLPENTRGTRVIQLADIKEDLQTYRPYNKQFDMYYDEFDEYDPTLFN